MAVGAIAPALISAIPSLVSGIGSIFGSSNTNDTQLQIAQENNALQKQMFYENLGYNSREAERNRDFNHVEALLNRDFQADQSQINRDFESIGSQVQRAYDAGINPQAILQGGMGSTPVQPSSSAASGTAASNSALPNFSLPHLLNPSLAWSQLSDVGLKTAQAANLAADTKKKESEKNRQDIENSKLPEYIESQINVNNKTANQMAASVDKINAEVDVLKETVNEIKANVALLGTERNLKDLQRKGQEIINFFQGDLFQAQIRNFNASSYRQEEEVKQAWQKLSIEQAVGNAQIGYFGSLSSYYGKLVEQVGYQNKYYQGMTNLLHWQSQRERQNYLFDTLFGPTERRLGIKERELRIKQFDYETDTWFRFQEGWKNILSPLGSIIGGAAGAYIGVKGLKGAKGAAAGALKGVSQGQDFLPSVPFN